MADGIELLVDSLCRAAFQPVQWMGMDGSGQPALQSSPSPLLQMLATCLQKAIEADPQLRAKILVELTKPEMLQMLVGELAKGIGKMRVSTSSWERRVDVPEWVNQALTTSLFEWLGTEEASGLIPQLLENSTIRITVERKDANEK